jgi:hypothetical protein
MCCKSACFLSKRRKLDYTTTGSIGTQPPALLVLAVLRSTSTSTVLVLISDHRDVAFAEVPVQVAVLAEASGPKVWLEAAASSARSGRIPRNSRTPN